MGLLLLISRTLELISMPPAARLTDMHVCPMLTALVPHVGGPIVAPGAPTVLIEFLPAARMTDMVTCVGPPDMIMMGSPTVLIEFLMAARMGDPTVHGGTIVLGAPTVMIGEVGMGSPGAVVVPPAVGAGGGGGGGGGNAASGPAETGASSITAGASRQDNWTPSPFVVAPDAAVVQMAAQANSPAAQAMVQASISGTPFCAVCALQQGTKATALSANKPSWVEIELVDGQGQPVPNEIYEVRLADGSLFRGELDGNGQARIEGIDPGTCQITFPNQDGKSWHPK
jgi:uncharacterized Zn-binding protein involved in type VI secretion